MKQILKALLILSLVTLYFQPSLKADQNQQDEISTLVGKISEKQKTLTKKIKEIEIGNVKRPLIRGWNVSLLTQLLLIQWIAVKSEKNLFAEGIVFASDLSDKISLFSIPSFAFAAFAGLTVALADSLLNFSDVDQNIQKEINECNWCLTIGNELLSNDSDTLLKEKFFARATALLN